MEEYLQVGAIANTHGVHGEVKVFPTTDDVNRFKKLKQVRLQKRNETLDLTVTQVRFFKNLVILKFKGYDRIEDVEGWKGLPLLVHRKDAVSCEKDEYFIADLIGLAVYEGESFIGTLTDVLQTGANDVYVVSKEGEADLLLPAIGECIRQVDLKKKTMEVHVLEGLRG